MTLKEIVIAGQRGVLGVALCALLVGAGCGRSAERAGSSSKGKRVQKARDGMPLAGMAGGTPAAGLAGRTTIAGRPAIARMVGASAAPGRSHATVEACLKTGQKKACRLARQTCKGPASPGRLCHQLKQMDRSPGFTYVGFPDVLALARQELGLSNPRGDITVIRPGRTSQPVLPSEYLARIAKRLKPHRNSWGRQADPQALSDLAWLEKRAPRARETWMARLWVMNVKPTVGGNLSAWKRDRLGKRLVSHALLLRARYALSDGKKKRAKALLKAITRGTSPHPLKPFAWFYLAAQAHREGKAAQAILHAQRAMKSLRQVQKGGAKHKVPTGNWYPRLENIAMPAIALHHERAGNPAEALRWWIDWRIAGRRCGNAIMMDRQMRRLGIQRCEK